MARKYDPAKLSLAAADWDIHHAIAADALEDDEDELK